MIVETLGIMLAATHLGPMDGDRTLPTPGAYIVTASGLTIGGYRNSLRRTSWQIGYTQEMEGRWAVSGGLVTGYQAQPIPFIAVSYRFGQNTGMRAIAMPHKTIPVAAAFEVR